MKTTLINFALFQLGWFGCVLTGAAGEPWIGALLAVAIVAWHLRWAPRPALELKLIGVAVGIGALWDTLLVYQGWLAYPSGMLLPFTAPYWIVIMWALFATTLNVSLRWLKGRALYATVFGAIGGPLAYFAGQRLGAVEFLDPRAALLALLIGWAVFTPLLIAVSQRYDGFTPARSRP
ncbi:MAG TPA: DUF2878 domain-containing protein [Gammaproteobacteria bacterium]|nr:DUF2878 domain-containing protein [Gammaproteobacteria bacterium]